MAIFSAPAYPDRDGITERFAPEAKGLLAFVNQADDARNSDKAMAETVGEVDHFTLNPPDNSPAARLERIMALLRKGDPVRALERAANLLGDAPDLPPNLKYKLRQSVEAGLHDLTIAGRASDADAWRRWIMPVLDPAAPEPALQYTPPRPAPGMGMVA
jgi:hypothetical protein